MSDWVWVGAMCLMGIYGFMVGTTVDTSAWSPSLQAWWWGFTHPFGPPSPWWSDDQRQDWFNANGKPWEEKS